jgi:hypothetical protein
LLAGNEEFLITQAIKMQQLLGVHPVDLHRALVEALGLLALLLIARGASVA